MSGRRKKKANRISLLEERPVNPTPETRRKLKPDPLWQMVEYLGSDRVRAAHEIRDALYIISAPLRVRVQRWGRLDESRGGYCGEHETERAVRIQQRYNAWVDRMSEEKIPVGPALDLIVEGDGCRQIEKARKWRHGIYRAYFFNAMEQYCKIAGWCR